MDEGLEASRVEGKGKMETPDARHKVPDNKRRDHEMGRSSEKRCIARRGVRVYSGEKKEGPSNFFFFK